MRREALRGLRIAELLPLGEAVPPELRFEQHILLFGRESTKTTDMNPSPERQVVPLQQAAEGRFFGMRHAAVPERQRIEGFLAQGFEVVVDFAGATVTQSFADELVGRLILEQGPHVLQRLVFKNCTDDTRAILRFVAADRLDQYLKKSAH